MRLETRETMRFPCAMAATCIIVVRSLDLPNFQFFCSSPPRSAPNTCFLECPRQDQMLERPWAAARQWRLVSANSRPLSNVLVSIRPGFRLAPKAKRPIFVGLTSLCRGAMVGSGKPHGRGAEVVSDRRCGHVESLVCCLLT